MASQTIKSFVLSRLHAGSRLEDIQREAQAEFPLRCVGLGYVMGIARAAGVSMSGRASAENPKRVMRT